MHALMVSAHVHLAFSSQIIVQDPCLGNDATHSVLAPPTFVNNQDNPLQARPQSNLINEIPQYSSTFLSSNCVAIIMIRSVGDAIIVLEEHYICLSVIPGPTPFPPRPSGM